MTLEILTHNYAQAEYTLPFPRELAEADFNVLFGQLTACGAFTQDVTGMEFRACYDVATALHFDGHNGLVKLLKRVEETVRRAQTML